MADLSNRIALVTGATRGVGRGVALGLAHAGATVFATGRSITPIEAEPNITAVVCDHTRDQAVADVFRQIDERHGRIDILVNVAWGGYERMVEDGRFTWAAPFWEQPLWRWEAMVSAGVRAAFVASQQAARRMAPAGRGLIVHISSWAAQKYGGNVIYGLAKAATDRMAADMAHQLRAHGVTVVALYPGLVRTEAVLAAGVFDLSGSESPEFIGRAVAALARDPDVFRRSGSVLVAAALAADYDFTDIDGGRPRPLTWKDV
jgi:dehydrogenase/reductase SDR family member 1